MVLLFLTIIGSVFAQNVVSTTDTSSPNSCDGAAVLADTANISPTSIYWTYNGAVIQQGGYFIDNLCPGTYTVTYNNGTGNITYTFIIGSGSSNPCNNFYTNISWTNNTDSVNCDGTAIVSVYGGTAPYTYMWSNGSTTMNQYNLCPGVYYCTVVDANGCSSSVTAAIDGSNGSNPNDSTIVISNGTYPDSTVVDTLGNASIEDCILDFLSVNSVYISNYNYSSLDSLLVTWTVVDSNGLVVATFNVPYGLNGTPNGVYTLFLTIFCPQKSMNINTIVAGDQLYLDGSQMGIDEDEQTEFSVVNPVGNEIQIVFPTEKDRSISLFDMNGKLLHFELNSSTDVTISASNLEKGMYILYITEEGVTTSRKILK